MEAIIPEINYQALATEIVKVACADYVDALIVKKQGFMSESVLKNKIYKAVIAYGERRYLYIDKHGRMQRRKESQNLKALYRIEELTNLKKNREMAEYDVRELEKFFKSGRFAIFMPNTNANWLITQWKKNALQHERIETGYKSNY